jgi:hypothetical protein
VKNKSFWGKQLLQEIPRFVVFGGVYASLEENTSLLAKLGSSEQYFSFKTVFFGIIERKRKAY